MFNEKNKDLWYQWREVSRELDLFNISPLDVNSVLYAAYLENSGNKSLSEIEDIELNFQMKLIYSKYEDKIKKIANKFTSEGLKELIIDNDRLIGKDLNRTIISDGLYKLLVDLLEINQYDKIADFQLNGASKIEYFSKDNTYSKLDVYESDMQQALNYKIKKNILNCPANILETSMYEESIDIKYNKILSPIRFKEIISEEDIHMIDKYYPELGKISKRSSDWVDILNSLLYLEEDGKIISIVSPSIMFSSFERHIREYFVENGLVESVISLPENLISRTFIGPFALVISRNNKEINFIDAKKIYTPIKRMGNDLTEEDRQDIINLISRETEKSTVASYEEVKEKDYILDPKRYLNNISFKKEVLLKDIAKSIDRGSNITNRELERYQTDIKTKYSFLNLADIQDGRIKDTRISLKENLVDSNEKLSESKVLKNGQLLLSRTGNPIRIAVVEDIKDELCFYSGNIYSISLDIDKYNPYYLKMFLESDLGQEMLNQISLGSVIPNISLKDLKEIKLPYIDIEEQNKVEALYLEYEKIIRDKELELAELRLKREEKLADIFSNKGVGLCN